MHQFLRAIAAGLGGLVLGAVGPGLSAQSDFPSRPIRMVIGFAPGGSNDLIGRMMATKLSERLGKQVVVDNRPGAGGIVASEIVAHAAPDGYTLMVVSIAHTANPFLYKLKYDTEKDFAAIAQLGTGTSVLAIHPGLPVNSVKELSAYAKANPGKLHMGHAGAGTFQHMASVQLLTMAGMDVVLVPYKGGGPVIIDLLAGHTQLSILTLVNTVGHRRSGKLKAIAVGSAQRVASAPDLSTIIEEGVAGYQAENWWGVVGPAGIPKPIVDKLAEEMAAVQDLPDFKLTLEREGAEPVKRGGDVFATFLASEMRKWAKVVKDGNVKME